MAFIAGRRSAWSFFMKLTAKTEFMMNATNNEANKVIISVIGRYFMKSPTIPGQNKSGKNGAMVVSQRNGTSSVTPANGDYTLDRWKFMLTQASKLTAAQSSTAPSGFNNSLLVTSSSAYSVGSGDAFVLQQFIEGFNFAIVAPEVYQFEKFNEFELSSGQVEKITKIVRDCKDVWLVLGEVIYINREKHTVKDVVEKKYIIARDNWGGGFCISNFVNNKNLGLIFCMANFELETEEKCVNFVENFAKKGPSYYFIVNKLLTICA